MLTVIRGKFATWQWRIGALAHVQAHYNETVHTDGQALPDRGEKDQYNTGLQRHNITTVSSFSIYKKVKSSFIR